MERAFIIDKFNTFTDWRLILTAKSITTPTPKTKYVNIDGMSGSLDLTESLSGDVTYNDRTVSASFVLTDGSFEERNRTFREISNRLHGRKVKLIEPDDPTHYLLGRVTVRPPTNRLAYGEISLEAVCDPWRYSINDSVRTVEVDGRTIDVVINNNGARTLVPEIKIVGAVDITFNNGSISLTTGSYKISDLRLYAGTNIITVSGTGTITLTYKEADI